MVEGRGEYSVRGGILDVFTPDSDNPYRIELFDTEVDSIRTFDLNTQRSEKHLKSVSIYPCSQIPREHQLFAEAEKNIRAAYEKQIRKLEKKEPGTEGRTAAGICREHDQHSVSGKIPPLFL